ncbi:hypothetical protein D779_2971 [Imhoffiella purpurea]|uniref:Uncharacterized protein n=1 Tax=Imhoffiella purpurea TaxID=1249627 RepID=W9VAX7_9GAMM|nr:hypothetical protein D779_2971 [Imhoffiella purpurea]
MVLGKGDVGDSEVMSKLILTREPVEEPIKIRITTGELSSIVARLQSPNPKIHEPSLA